MVHDAQSTQHAKLPIWLSARQMAKGLDTRVAEHQCFATLLLDKTHVVIVGKSVTTFTHPKDPSTLPGYPWAQPIQCCSVLQGGWGLSSLTWCIAMTICRSACDIKYTCALTEAGMPSMNHAMLRFFRCTYVVQHTKPLLHELGAGT